MALPAEVSEMHEVYAYGMIAPSTLLELADDFPQPAGYAEIDAVYPSIGGEAAGSAYVLARLGVTVKLAGNRLGNDESSARTIELLSGAGVDCSAIPMVGDGPSVTEVVVASGESRTIFGTYRKLTVDRGWDEGSEADVRSSSIVCVDPFFIEESIQVARWSEASGTPYVTVDASPDSEVAHHAEVLIVSEEFAGRSLGTHGHETVGAFTDRCRGLVILTQGGDRIVSGRAGEQPREHATFPANVRDTTGAGDGFRAGIIYGMLRGLDTEGLIRTAGAVAALVCERVPGVLNSPTEADLESFLASHR